MPAARVARRGVSAEGTPRNVRAILHSRLHGQLKGSFCRTSSRCYSLIPCSATSAVSPNRASKAKPDTRMAKPRARRHHRLRGVPLGGEPIGHERVRPTGPGLYFGFA